MPSTLIQEIVQSTTPMSLAIAFAALLLTIAYWSMKFRGLPPGPTGVPFLGMWPFLKGPCHFQLAALTEKYGDVFSFSCTGQLYIHLGSAKAVREAHISNADSFTGRTKTFSLFLRIFGGGIAAINGEPWKIFRKFFTQSLRERAVLSLKNSQVMDDALKSTIADLREKNGEPLDINELLSIKCSSVLRMTLLGDIGVSEEQLNEIVELYTKMVSSGSPRNMLLAGNLAKYLMLPLQPAYRETMRSRPKMENAIYKLINEHRSTYDENNIRGIIDEFIREKNERRRKSDPTAEYFTDEVLMASLLQIVGDGVLAVTGLIGVIIKVLLEHPGEQQKIYDELVEVVGLDRDPTLEDKSKLSYFNAFIFEICRTSDLFPIFASLECTRETTLRGYRIPKGAITVINTMSAHYDPKVYDEPKKFNPSRFITTEGKKRPELPIVFGVGKRACLGEGFTMMQTFLFLATIIKNFHLTLDNNSTTSDYELLRSGNLKICAHLRNQE